MASIMRVALPVIAIAGAAFTGGTSLGLFGADAAATAAAAGGGAMAAGDIAAGSDIAAGADTFAAVDSTASGASWLGNTISTVSPYVKGAAAVATVGGTALQAYGADEAGKAQQQEANSEALQLNNNANNQEASAESKMVEQNRETAYVISNAQAAAAAGGGSATDPTVTTDLKTIAGEGRYRALTDLYQGQSNAQAMRNQANADIYGGEIAANAGTTKMYSTILGGASSLYDKYGTIDDKTKTSAYGAGTPSFLQSN